MSVETSMYNNQINPPFQPAHLRSRSFNELLNLFKQSVTSEQSRIRSRKRSYNDVAREDSLTNIKASSDSDINTKRSRTAPPQSPSPIHSSQHKGDANGEAISVFDKNSIKRARSESPNKISNITSPSTSPPTPSLSPNLLRNKILKPSAMKKEKSKITLPSFSTVMKENVKVMKPITPTTSLDYFDTYKPNDENWRYGLMDTMTKNKYNLSNYTVSSSSTRPVFDSKIVLPPISVERERKINFPYESNYTYLNKTYLNDVERYPEYLELAQSLVQLSNSNASRVHTRRENVPPLYAHELEQRVRPEEELRFEQQLQEQRAFEQQSYQQQQQQQQQQQHNSHHAQYYPPYQPYPAFMASPSATVVNVPTPYAYPSEQPVTPPKKHTKFIPITPPSSKANKSKTDSLKSPKSSHPPRVCISCGSDQSPCWRPSWSSKEGQLCNSCGLRYKKTAARCLNDSCKKIPAKGEWSLMQTKGKTTFDDGSEGYSCLECGHQVEVNK